MTNLLEETLHILNINGKVGSDVLFCQTDAGSFSWADFVEKANYYRYLKERNWDEVNTSLVIVGEDFWMERWRDQGSVERWKFLSKPCRKPKLEYFSSSALNE